MKPAKPKTTRWFGIIRPAPPLHFHILQGTAFLYLGYRLASRNYALYGHLPEQAFHYPNRFVLETGPFLEAPLSHWTTFHFIYDILGHPGYDTLFAVQIIGLATALCGLLGIYPKVAASLGFLIKAHLTGFVQATNGEIDGGTLCMVALFVLVLAPKDCFYKIYIRSQKATRSRDANYHWPIFLLWTLVGTFYFMAGLNKLIDVGLHWNFAYHMENLVFTGLEKSIFKASRLVTPEISSLMGSPWLSILAGSLVLWAELAFLGILFAPRIRFHIVSIMILMHFFVYWLAGINFLGSSLILILCLDWNTLERKGSIYFDDQCSICLKYIRILRKIDIFKRFTYCSISQLDKNTPLSKQKLHFEMGFEDEKGDIQYGGEAFEQIAHRCPILYPMAIIMKIPGVLTFSSYVYMKVATKRYRLSCNTSCST